MGSPLNSWRIINDRLQYKYHPGHGTVCLNGTLYWLDFCNHQMHLFNILAFDMANETFQKFTPPP